MNDSHLRSHVFCVPAGLLLAAALSVMGQDSATGTWKADEVAFAPWTFILKADGGNVKGEPGEWI